MSKTRSKSTAKTLAASVKAGIKQVEEDTSATLMEVGDTAEPSKDVEMVEDNQTNGDVDEPAEQAEADIEAEEETTEKSEKEKTPPPKTDKEKSPSRKDKVSKSRNRRRQVYRDKIPDIIANDVRKQRNEAWKKTVMMGPIQWEDVEDNVVRRFIQDCCTLSIIYRKKQKESTDCHLELRFVNQGDAANCTDKLDRPIRAKSGHTIRLRTRMPLESQLQEWDQMMMSRMYMGNRVFLFVDNIPATAVKEEIFATFPSCSYITFTLKPDLQSGYCVLEYRGEEDIDDDLTDDPKMLHGNVLTTYKLTRTTQFYDRGRPVSQRNREIEQERERGGRYGDQGRFSGRSYDQGNSYRGGGGGMQGMMGDQGSLNNLESMLLQEIGRKVMMQGQGMMSGGGSSGRRSGGRRW